ncbi:MAG TPA: ribonucleotide reductase N-terminal alpha domain-containing protein [Methanothermobacter sp.]|nr:ribonucleoside-diphosphate reductase [Methanothermobacter sp. MT-2]HHW05022.1 ribonucleotide reductase [Methanothermobacter sp.]HOK72528.1 ribonucleotide reductase N-terminal alpha domain-containing protein [Methanothermobacter sp.]HOL69409.1 ribonucleotide reductase N-terminal alpha domain-containing protein [Methanothermobacter sp.]HPQ04015.1 ribonucleotide reductase N-terminal alpha domain-containing protein [Methanothermobacter sp.]
MKLTPNALKVLKERYLLKNERGKIIETPKEMFKRVALAVAQAEEKYDGDTETTAKEFYNIMSRLEFLPNSPTLMNAGTPINQLSACFVLPIKDSMDSIFDALKYMALIHKSGGGVGFSFSHLRPKGDIVGSTMGVASGPVSFMRIFDVATEVIKQGGRRRGANMGILDVNHPDIIEFIEAKKEEGAFNNFNLSVMVNDDFMDGLASNKECELINPRTGEVTDTLPSQEIFNKLVKMAWKRGDPGILFKDAINRANPTPTLGSIEATNPCVSQDTWIMTSKGPKQVKELIGEDCEIILNGKRWKSPGGFFPTGKRRLYRLETVEGFQLRLTPEHRILKLSSDGKVKWRKLSELKIGDKVIINSHKSLEWDGKFTEDDGYTTGLALNGWDNPKLKDVKITDEIEKASSKFYTGLFKGLLDSNSKILFEGDFETARILQRMLLRLGIFTNINNSSQSQLKMVKSHETFATVKNIIPDSIETVYDIHVPGINAFDANGFYVHNCGEQPLLPYESCNLGSINLSLMVENGKINWERLSRTVKVAVHFLDNVIDINTYPIKKIEETTKKTRKIGLGVMGFADMLIKLGIAYNSKSALNIADKLMSHIKSEAQKASMELALQRGSFPAFKESRWYQEGFECMRNATLTTIAPTGSLSIIAGVTSSIEPIFAVSFIREILDRKLVDVNPLFEAEAKKKGFYDKKLMEKIAKEGSLNKIEGIPAKIKRLFVTAHEIDPIFHVKMQATFQKHVDNAVSKTVNLPRDAKPEDVEKVFKTAYKLGCKGITVYRYGSKKREVLRFPESIEYAGTCRDMTCPN